MIPNSSRVRKWKSWLPSLIEEVGRLESFLSMRQQFGKIVMESHHKGSRDFFWTFAGFSMIDELVIRIGRLCDRQNNTKERRVRSLRAMLDECEKYHSHFSRRRVLGRVKPPDDRVKLIGYNYLNTRFDEWVGKHSPHLPQSAITDEIKVLETTTRKIIVYRNKFVAHIDFQKNSRRAPKLIEVTNSVEILKTLTQKYAFLIDGRDVLKNYHTGSDLVSLFRSPWIATPKKEQELRQLFEDRYWWAT